jgi:hypothetical protein
MRDSSPSIELELGICQKIRLLKMHLECCFWFKVLESFIALVSVLFKRTDNFIFIFKKKKIV